MRSFINNLREKPESYRHKVALLSASAITLIIFFSWAGERGYIGLPTGLPESEIVYQSKERELSEAQVTETRTPLQNTASALLAAFGQISGQYELLKESLSNVFVPFISGIEVYESK